MDRTDVALITALQRDGRQSYLNVARRLHLGEATVRRRVKRLLKEGVIRIVAIPDPSKVGTDCSALIGLNVDLPHVDRVMESLAKENNTYFVACTTGRFDVFVGVNCSSQKEMATFVTERLSAIEGIRQSETFLYLKVRKWDYRMALWQQR